MGGRECCVYGCVLIYCVILLISGVVMWLGWVYFFGDFGFLLVMLR